MTLLIPKGSRLGRTGAGLQPKLFAIRVCLCLVIMNVTSLYSIKATMGPKINGVVERILSARGTQLQFAIRTNVAFWTMVRELPFNMAKQQGEGKTKGLLFPCSLTANLTANPSLQAFITAYSLPYEASDASGAS